jgi:radical SAM protein with 4Fe4S-binding SPASM domain
MAVKSLEICKERGIDCTIITCAMRWNFTHSHIDGLLKLARTYDTHIRINPFKPVQQEHLQVLPDMETFYDSFSYLMAQCKQVDLGEPLLASACSYSNGGCPCGRKSFRIHSITPDGKVPISPCVYLHEYKIGDLLVDDIFDVIYSPQFQIFRRRVANPAHISGCAGCNYLEYCRGGCAARSYLYNLHKRGMRSLFIKDPYCLRDYEQQAGNRMPVFPQKPSLPQDKILVHRDYLCTWIGEPLRQEEIFGDCP